jgi:hypothetical protein
LKLHKIESQFYSLYNSLKQYIDPLATHEVLSEELSQKGAAAIVNVLSHFSEYSSNLKLQEMTGYQPSYAPKIFKGEKIKTNNKNKNKK